MFQKLALVLIAATGLTAATLPSQAAVPVVAHENLTACTDTGDSKDINDNTDPIADELSARGYNVSGVEEWGGCIRAYVTDAHGHTSMKLFDPDTLQPINEG